MVKHGNHLYTADYTEGFYAGQNGAMSSSHSVKKEKTDSMRTGF
jgi:hypothetical protein